MPAIGKILIVFASMLILTRLRVQLGLALALGGLILNFWAGIPVFEAAVNFGQSLLSAELWLFLAISVLIIEMSRFMTEGRNAEEIVAAVQRLGGRFGGAATLMVLPAMIGLMPMPAGALFSAPFVQQTGGKIDGTPEWKSAVNYWFRHIWEYWWPLYPGVIVAMSVFDMEAWQFISTQIFYTPVVVFAGYFFLIRPYLKRLSDKSGTGEGSNRRALFLLLPLMVVIVSLFIIPFVLVKVFPGFDVEIRKLLAMVIGLIAGLVIFLWDEGRGRRRTTDDGQRTRRMFSTLFEQKSLNVLFSLAGVLIFKFLLKKSGLLPLASEELVRSGIPVLYAVAALPFIAGFVTGIAIGFTGTSFPLVVGLMTAEGSGLTPLATLVLAYGFGYAGMILSPVHLCLLVTKDYFTASLMAIYRQIFPCVLSALVYCIAAHVLLRVLGW